MEGGAQKTEAQKTGSGVGRLPWVPDGLAMPLALGKGTSALILRRYLGCPPPLLQDTPEAALVMSCLSKPHSWHPRY